MAALLLLLQSVQSDIGHNAPMVVVRISGNDSPKRSFEGAVVE
jgi:hypothetical protein